MTRKRSNVKWDGDSRPISGFRLNGLNWQNIVAWLSMAVLQLATLPAVIEGLNGNVRYPLSSIVMIMAGLLGYMIRAIAARDMLYIVGNGIGLTINGVFLWVLL